MRRMVGVGGGIVGRRSRLGMRRVVGIGGGVGGFLLGLFVKDFLDILVVGEVTGFANVLDGGGLWGVGKGGRKGMRMCGKK